MASDGQAPQSTFPAFSGLLQNLQVTAGGEPGAQANSVRTAGPKSEIKSGARREVGSHKMVPAWEKSMLLPPPIPVATRQAKKPPTKTRMCRQRGFGGGEREGGQAVQGLSFLHDAYFMGRAPGEGVIKGAWRWEPVRASAGTGKH